MLVIGKGNVVSRYFIQGANQEKVWENKNTGQFWKGTKGTRTPLGDPPLLKMQSLRKNPNFPQAAIVQGTNRWQRAFFASIQYRRWWNELNHWSLLLIFICRTIAYTLFVYCLSEIILTLMSVDTIGQRSPWVLFVVCTVNSMWLCLWCLIKLCGCPHIHI